MTGSLSKRIELDVYRDFQRRDISVGGAAIKVWAPLYQADIFSIDIDVLGEFEGLVLRSIEDETFAILRMSN